MTERRTSNDRKRLAILGALGLGLAMAARRHREHHYAFSQMHQGGDPAGATGFGGHGPWRRQWPSNGGTLPPKIDAKLRAWHEQAHDKAATSDARQQPGSPTQV